MSKLIDRLNWIGNGERGNALIFNRALKELVNIIDLSGFDFETSGNNVTIAVEKTQTVDANDFVYIDSIGDLAKSNVSNGTIGVYITDGISHSLKTSGVVKLSGLIPGTEYYLNNVVIGGISTYVTPERGSVGVALNETDLLLTIGGNGESSGGGGVGSTINMTQYSVEATEGQTVINTNYNPSNVLVFADGVIMPTEFYTATDGTSITFNTPLDNKEKIYVQSFLIVEGAPTPYTETDFTATEGQTVFNIEYNPSKVNVFVGGIKLRKNEYTANNGTTVTLKESLSVNEWVQITS